MADLTTRFKELKEKKDLLLKRKMEAEVKASNLEEDVKTGLKELQEKYQVSSITEAKELYESKEAELKEKLEEIDEKLSIYESSINEV